MHHFRAFYFSLTLIVLVGCSTTKDEWINRKYHETTARYNAYFNGVEAFNEAVESFEKTEELDFEKMLPLYYWPNEQQAPSLFSKLDRALEKSAKVIKGHSMVFSGKQKNPYVVKAYLLIANSRFYKHEFIQTLEATAYIIDQFGALEMAEEEVFWAKLLAAQTHVRMGNSFAAETLLDDIYTKRLPKKMLHAAQKGYAYFHIETGNLREAQGWVEMAFETAPNREDMVRLSYINAQLLAKLGMGYESALAYEKVLELHPSNYDITFSAQIKRAENFDVYMEDISVIEKELRGMLKDDKNSSYQDQIYYVWALKELDLEHYPEGETLLRNSISSSTNNQKQKGKSYLKLAEVEFDFREFVLAKSYYDSALTALPPGYPGTDTLQDRVEVLGELVLHYNEVKLQDSLQAMYGMSDESLRQKFEAFVEQKKALEAEAVRQAEISAMNALQNAALADAGPVAGQGSGKWYFYNPSVRSSGLAAFKRTWGDRDIEDHWRQKEKPVDGFGDIDLSVADADSTAQSEVLLPRDDNSVEYYLARVLKDEQDLKESLKKEANALTELGFVYKDGLSDFDAAEDAWNSYLDEFISASLTPKVWYGKYLLYNRLQNEQERELAKRELITNYSASPYAALVRGESQKQEIPLEEQTAYEKSYAAFLLGNVKQANAAIDNFKSMFPESRLIPKIALLEAYVLGLEEKGVEVVEQLKQVTTEHKGSQEAARAAQILTLLLDNNKDNNNTQGSGDLQVRLVKFDDQPNAPHKIVFAIPAQNADINNLRNALADFNKDNFKFDNLRIQNIFYDQNTQLVIISGLRSKAKAAVWLNSYETQGSGVKQFYPIGLSEVFYINNPNFGKVYRDKVLKDYIQYFKEL
jgi:hypothetical protein